MSLELYDDRTENAGNTTFLVIKSRLKPIYKADPKKTFEKQAGPIATQTLKNFTVFSCIQ